MKVALLTFHDTTNFGSFLQTYGLYSTLNKLEIDCEVLNYQCAAIRRKELPQKRPESWTIKKIAKFLLLEPTKAQKYENMMGDVTRLLKLSQRFDRSNIQEAEDLYDAFLVGSDILWGLDITEGDTAYFLDFVGDKNKKFAFSTSVGNPWSEKEKAIVAPFLNEFTKIAVREQEAAEWVGELTGTMPKVACDPTMLVEENQWKELANQSNCFQEYKKTPYVLTYFGTNDGRLHDEALNYARSKGYELWTINYGIPQKNCKNIKPTHVEDFLALILNAQCVFTASYHGMMFSIYFQRPFYFYNDSHGSRFDSVAERLNLESQKRLPNMGFCERSINYGKVTHDVLVWREESTEILRNYWR